jgi:hypothetical protein
MTRCATQIVLLNARIPRRQYYNPSQSLSGTATPPCARICGVFPVQFVESLLYSAHLRRITLSELAAG